MELNNNGFTILRGFSSTEEVSSIIAEIESSDAFDSSGERNIEQKLSSVKDWLESKKVNDLLTSVLGEYKFIRGIYFDKIASRNWHVRWHQDKTIAVEKKFEKDGWHSWSLKDGVYHVQPPLEIMEKVLTLRLHLDKTDKTNGCLKVIEGSHLKGIMSQEESRGLIQNSGHEFCECHAGDLLLMKPLILHSSDKALVPVHRRVLHFEFIPFEN